MALPNGFDPGSAQVQAPRNAEVIAVLERVLAMARDGKITTLGVIMVGPMGGYMKVAAGIQGSDLHAGACSLAKQLLESFDNPRQAAGPTPLVIAR